MENKEQLQDIIFINIADAIKIDEETFELKPEIPLPVQLPDGIGDIDRDAGIKVEMIAAGLIRVVAHQPENENSEYYRLLLLAMQPDIVHELQLGAIAKANNGELEFAKELFLAASYLNSNIPEIFVNLAVIYAQQAKEAEKEGLEEKFEEAITNQIGVLNRGLEANPLSELLLSEIGLLHLYLQNLEVAYEYLQSYLKLAPKSDKRDLIEKEFANLEHKVESDQTLNAAFDEMQLGNEQQALKLVNSYIETNPKVWSGYFIKGWALRRLENYEEAREAFLKCLELGEQNADIYNELSICALEMDQRDLAKEYLTIALELEEDNVKLLSNLAFLNLQDELYDEAKELLERALEIDKNDPAIIHLKEELAKRVGYEEDEDLIEL